MKSVEIIEIDQSNYEFYDQLVQLRLYGKIKLNILNEHQYTQLNRNDFFVFIAKYKGEPVGWIQAIVIPKLGSWSKNVLYIDELWVIPEYRRLGIGKQLCDQIYLVAKQINVDRIRLYTENPNAQRLYEKSEIKTKGYCVFMESDSL